MSTPLEELSKRKNIPVQSVPKQSPPIADVNAEKCALITLGMHRSGTSAFTGMLDLLGCTTPLIQIPSSPQNPKGFFEAEKIVLLNDRILADTHSNWHDWSEFKQDLIGDAALQEWITDAKIILAKEFGTSRMIALKDPRICRFAPLWLRVLKESGFAVLPVHIHRNPLEVSQSLLARNNFSPELGIMLWLRHVLDAEISTRGRSRVFSSYALLLEDWQAQAHKIKQKLGTRLPEISDSITREVDSFLCRNLQNHTKKPCQILENKQYSSWVRNTFDIMEDWSKFGENTKDHETLDDIRRAFNSTTLEFSDIFDAGDIGFKKVTPTLDGTDSPRRHAEDMLKKQLKYNKIIEKHQAVANAQAAQLNELKEKLRVANETATLAISRQNAAEKAKTDIHKEAQQKNKKKNVELSTLRNELNRARLEAEMATHNFTEVLNSTSWRVSAPVRMLGKVLKPRK